MTNSHYSMSAARYFLPQMSIRFCMLIFIACMGASVAPQHYLTNILLFSMVPTSTFFAAWSVWLSPDLHLLSNALTSQTGTNDPEFFLLIALAFVLYGISALVIRYQLKETKNTGIWYVMWAGAILVGLIFVFTPTMLSHDIFVYADYGHTIVAYRGNPYFVPPGVLSQDVLTQLDDWRMYITAYGPLWLDICSFLALFLGNIPWHYIFGFRLLGLVAHLMNILLVTTILRKAGGTERTILPGTWLYAMNPLVLLESSFGAHNDIFMATFLLLGILLCMRAEQKGFTHPASYVPPVVAFTLSALIKFTTLPLIIFFLILLARKTLYSTSTGTAVPQHTVLSHWRSTCMHVFFASLTCGITLLAFYAPFWPGHTFKEIIHSFSLPPSSFYAENSLARVLHEWIRRHGLPPETSWAYLPMHLFSQHIVWDMLNVGALGCTMGIGIFFLWRTPTTQTFILAALICLGALLIVTPWFYSWYVIWLIALAVASFSLPDNPLRRALTGFALMFSFTAFLTYMSSSIVLLGEWASFVQFMLIPGLPLLVFLLLFHIKMTGSSANIARRVR